MQKKATTTQKVAVAKIESDYILLYITGSQYIVSPMGQMIS